MAHKILSAMSMGGRQPPPAGGYGVKSEPGDPVSRCVPFGCMLISSIFAIQYRQTWRIPLGVPNLDTTSHTGGNREMSLKRVSLRDEWLARQS